MTIDKRKKLGVNILEIERMCVAAGIGQEVVGKSGGTVQYWLMGALFEICPEVLDQGMEWITKDKDIKQ